MTPETDIRELVAKTIGRILADAAFLFTDALDGPPPLDASWEPIGIALSFKGLPSGQSRMWVDPRLAQAAAANMRGLDEPPDPADPKTLDAMRELLNISLGNLLTGLYGEEPVYELGLPELLPAHRFAEDKKSSLAVWLQAEETPLLFILEVAS